ncbi:hypothetical protein LP316_12535 [Thalassotalea sp. LPB0316]|uniref:hypothetical protein n=1 Tax=Thalassotalea sp. LPB0316 TaxID=2769490 RepID=UPI001867F575|nr:hypothetical protein [Thalassotalea sp. LPB0316]QOL25121.1 hypothetical protein LP316_12535 [Thalassotalea sp. LPB0316]
MNTSKVFIAIIMLVLLSACQSTNYASSVKNEQNINYSTPHHNDANSAMTKPIVLASFKSRNKQKTKRIHNSDSQLAYSLANRHIPKDQLMMLAFEQNRQQSIYVQTGFFVDIRGSQAQDPGNNSAQLAWQHNDANAKTITGPK